MRAAADLCQRPPELVDWEVEGGRRDWRIVEVTGVRQREAWVAGVMPPVERVRDGLWSIPVPIPGSPLRYVLVYALELPGGVAIVDAGWDCEDAWQALVAGLGTAGFEVADVRAVLVTHIHPDHFGLAGRVREKSGAWIGMHPADAALVGHDDASLESVVAHGRAQLAATGAPDPVVHGYSVGSPGIQSFRHAGPDRLIEDHDVVDLPGWDLRAVWTPGHTPGHLCFHERGSGVLLSGDHVLPRISPNISVQPRQLADPLGTYLRSLRSVGEIDADEVLPAHEYRFRGLRERTDALMAHHDERLAEIEKAVLEAPGSTCWEITTRLTWSRPFDTMPEFLLRLAVRESLAHLVLLESRGRLRRGAEEVPRWFPVQ
ncbi:glyoxylase-like metal-dependent hydrolase (beta-lactamase superfamily II) [Saccharopolyspora erythraea NRRL 2338]|nr:glyoxylase-like metal-dependent hydrolase (beta-lactamase superfamily II) [Saccharopolyspora erythraea NRRL 2338]